ncbi:dihydropteroate synthase [Lacticaseibacillus baoqingensis]|uniref:Dihydropteroate synthase n=1 Tax=Lacticaseibacillus baoqingensis TaxID=2486013 RepID=A0ABW4E722_9LACO|nr:dihydropteroate synthase [Lacticaseibacillus baoqingensis]
MQITEVSTITGNDLGAQVLRAAQKRGRQVILQFAVTAAQRPFFERLCGQFDLVAADQLALVPQAALAPLAQALQAQFPAAAAEVTAIAAAHRVLWQTARQTFDVSAQPLIYGILNVSPDSFYDGGRFVAPADMQAHVRQMVESGVDVIEVGGQTTRPGFTPIAAAVECERILPVIAWLQAAYPDLPLAVDTYKYPVMQAVVDAGVDIINDVNGFTDDPRKLSLLADHQVGLLTMHSNRDSEYLDLTKEMRGFFTKNLAALAQAGIARERIALDQGIGYAKVADGHQDYTMMRNLDMLNDFNRPLMVAISRKGFGHQLFGLKKDDRLPVTLVAETAMFLKGGNILRVHDIAETVQLRKMLQVIQQAYWAPQAPEN